MLWISCSWLLLTTAEFPPFVEVMHRPPRRCCRCPAKLRPVKKLIQPSPNQLFPPNLNPDFHMFELQILQTWILKQNYFWNHTDHTQLLPSVPLKSPPKFPRLEPGAENPGRILHLPRKHHPVRWWPSRSFAVRSLGSSWGGSKVLPSKSHKKYVYVSPTGEFNRNLNFQSKSFKKTYHTTSWNCVNFPQHPSSQIGWRWEGFAGIHPCESQSQSPGHAEEIREPNGGWTEEVSWWVVKPI